MIYLRQLRSKSLSYRRRGSKRILIFSIYNQTQINYRRKSLVRLGSLKNVQSRIPRFKRILKKCLQQNRKLKSNCISCKKKTRNSKPSSFHIRIKLLNWTQISIHLKRKIKTFKRMDSTKKKNIGSYRTRLAR